MYHLLTWSGNVVCFSDTARRFVHRPLQDGLDPGRDIVPFDLVESAGPEGGLLVPRFPEGRHAPVHAARPGLAFRLERSAERRAWHLRQGDVYACAEPGGEVVVNRAKASRWEEFLLIRDEELARLSYILGNHWIHKASRSVVRSADIGIGERFTLRLGPFVFDLRDNFAPLQPGAAAPGTGAEGPALETTLFRQRWAPEAFALYRPLIYAAAFGDDAYLSCFEVAAASAVALGGYDGEMLLLTDREASRLDRLSATLGGRLHARRLEPERKIDFMASRYTIGRWPLVTAFQPILYIDVDVVFDAPVEPLLTDIALHTRLSAQQEDWAPLDKEKSVGALLFREIGARAAPTKGFNSGVIGLPNWRVAARHFEDTLAALYRYYETNSWEGRRHIDQPFFNFVAARGHPLDPWPVTPRVRWFRRGAIHGGERPAGLVHFWGAGDAANTLGAMSAYLEAALPAPAPAPARVAEEELLDAGPE